MADAEVNFALQAEDEYSGVFDELQSQIDGLSGTDIELGVSADSSGLDDVRSAVDDLTGISNIDIPVEVSGDAEATIEEISSDLAALDGADARLSVTADDQASDVLDQIGTKLDELSISAANVGDLLTAGLAGGIGGAAVGAAGDVLGRLIGAVTEIPGKAAEAESASVRLQLAVEKSGVSWSSVADQTEKNIEALMKATAVDDEKIKSTAATLLYMGMNYDTAMSTLAASLDLAAARQMDVETSASLLGRAWQGNYSILKRYGITIDESIQKSGDFMAALDLLEKKFGGTAVAMAGTMEGQMNRAGNAWENFQEWVGGGINTLSKTLLGGLNWLFGGGGGETKMPTAPNIAQGVTVTKSSGSKDYWITGTYQHGGVVTKPTLAMVGEKGKEYVLNEKQMEALYSSLFRTLVKAQKTEPDILGNVTELMSGMGISNISKILSVPKGSSPLLPLSRMTSSIMSAANKRDNWEAVTNLISSVERDIKDFTMMSKKITETKTKMTGVGVGAPAWMRGGGASFFPTGPTRGELYPATPQPQTMNLNINVRGATMADLQFASEVGKELAKLNVLSGASRRWP